MAKKGPVNLILKLIVIADVNTDYTGPYVNASTLLDNFCIGCDIPKEHEHEVIITMGPLHILQLRHMKQRIG